VEKARALEDIEVKEAEITQLVSTLATMEFPVPIQSTYFTHNESGFVDELNLPEETGTFGTTRDDC
jgi:hypothetical protein